MKLPSREVFSARPAAKACPLTVCESMLKPCHDLNEQTQIRWTSRSLLTKTKLEHRFTTFQSVTCTGGEGLARNPFCILSMDARSILVHPSIPVTETMLQQLVMTNRLGGPNCLDCTDAGDKHLRLQAKAISQVVPSKPFAYEFITEPSVTGY